MNNAIPAAPGIYKITCTVNKKIYIGSAVNLRKRQSEHFSALRRNKHSNRHLQNAWNKYGEQAFIFEVLEQVLPMDPTHREQYWFKKLKPFGRRGFNIHRVAGSSLGQEVSPEQREKLRQVHLGKKLSPEHRKKIGQSRLGYKQTTEHIEKVRQTQLGRKHPGRKLSPEHKEKLRQVNLGKKASPETRMKMSQSHRRKREQVSA